MTGTHDPNAVQNAIKAAEKPEETTAQAIARLATLTPLEYEKIRKAEAERLDIDRVSILDAEVEKERNAKRGEKGAASIFPIVEPSVHRVDGAALLDEILATIKRFIVCDHETAVAATLWIAFSWFIDDVEVAPLAIITAPEKMCGKSQMLALIGKLSRRPLMASNISPAAIFRVVEAHNPTLLIDEADTFLRENDEARGIINSGHTRSSAYCIRNVGDDHEPKQFSTWGAKVLCGIGTLADTTMSRAIILELRRKLTHEKVDRLRQADPAHFERLCSMLARYAEDNGHAIKISRPILPDALNDRAQDNWEPLLAIADHAGGNWPSLGRMAALKISGMKEKSVSLSTELLGDIQEIFTATGSDKIATYELLEALNKDDLKPWATYNRGKPIAAHQLAKRLGEYGIKPKTMRIGAGKTKKGFMKAWFEDAFRRYLPLADDPAHSPVTKKQSNDYNAIGINLPVTNDSNVTDENNPNSLKNNNCYDVTDITTDIQDVEEGLAIQQFDEGVAQEEIEATNLEVHTERTIDF